MTSEEQLSEWVAGRPIHRSTNHHGSQSPVRGSKNGHWKCNDCGAVGTMSELKQIPCPKGGECCPDFSCCRPELQWPEEKRKRFAAATEQEQHGMLIGALQAAFDYEEIRKVRII